MGRPGEPSAPFGKVGKEQADAMVGMQKEILEAYEQASRVWLDRMKSEVQFWSDLTSKLSATRSLPEAMETYQKSVAQRMQMAAEDGRRMTEDYQKIMQKFSGPMSNGWPTRST
jgi:hypothetical protein